MIQIQYLGMMGNRMFQYAYARILAERLGLALTCEPVDSLFPKAVPISGMQVSNDYVVYKDDNGHDGINETARRQILVYGFLQKYIYYKKHKDTYKKWFSINVTNKQYDTVVHIRRGDYYVAKTVMDLAWYENILKRLNGLKYVVGVGLDKTVKERLSKYGAVFSSDTYRKDYSALLNAKTVVMSNSTFCWWAVWLGRATKAYFPVVDTGPFSRANLKRNDLFVDEKRYEYIPAKFEAGQ